MKRVRCSTGSKRVFAAEFFAFLQSAARKRFLVAAQVVISLRLAMAADERRGARSFAADKFSTKPARLKKIFMRSSAEVYRKFPRAHFPNPALTKMAV
jgi:hypothetical protein